MHRRQRPVDNADETAARIEEVAPILDEAAIIGMSPVRNALFRSYGFLPAIEVELDRRLL